MMKNPLLANVACMAALGFSASLKPASADSGSGTFGSPSHPIGCDYHVDYLRCDVVDGVKSVPRRAKDCEADYGQGFDMDATGPARVVCAGDSDLGAKAVVRYGATWHNAAFTCRSTTAGMRCTNAHKHGFFISRGEAYRF